MNTKLKPFTKTIIIISSMISICLVLFIAYNANRYISRMSKNNSELYSAYKISELMKSFKSNVAVLEAKQRGYVITGDGKFLEAYKQKETETKTYLKSMEKYFSGKSEEAAFYKLKELTYKKLMEAKDLNTISSIIGVPNESNNTQVIGIKTMSEINSTVDAINDSLSKTTKQLLDNSIEYVDVSKKWSYLEITLGILTALAAVIILLNDINTRNKLEDELRVAKKQAENNALMKEQFMANMSHEIRTPMNAILGFSDLLQKTPLTKTQTDYLLAVTTSGSNLLNIINDILDFSKIEAGKLNIEKISFNLLNLFDTLQILFKQKAIEKHVQFKVDVDRRTPAFIFGDPTRLTQILTNLINNAIKFTKQGEVNVACAVDSIDNTNVQFKIKISDTGIGIPTDKIHSVFERFNQGNTETTRKYGGTGLGLAIVKQLVDIQNGTITLKSKEGVGSEFTIILTYPISHENRLSVNDGANSNLKINSTTPYSVLLAEDNVLNQKLASIYLKGFGLEVDIVENGLEALEKVKTNVYHLILMDIQMPLLDGYVTSKKIREDLKINIPIIAMTANIMANEREKCLSYGMTDYISKPFKEYELFKIVNHYLEPKDIENEQVLTSSKNIEIANHEDLLDLSQLRSLSRGNKKIGIEIISLFLNQCPLDLEQIERAIISADYDSVKSIAHKMKTSVGFIGMTSTLQKLSLLENCAEKNKDVNEILNLFTSITEKCKLASIQLKKELNSLEVN